MIKIDLSKDGVPFTDLTFDLPPELIEKVDEAAAFKGLSREELLKQIFESILENLGKSSG